MNESQSQGVQESRRADRHSVAATVHMRLDSDTVAGVTDNLSDVGVMFFTDEPLRCSIRIGEGPDAEERSGRIVRLQRMNETNTGLAIEFDEE